MPRQTKSIHGESALRRSITTPTGMRNKGVAEELNLQLPFAVRSRYIRGRGKLQPRDQILRLQAHYSIPVHGQDEVDRLVANAFVHQPFVLDVQAHQGDDAL